MVDYIEIVCHSALSIWFVSCMQKKIKDKTKNDWGKEERNIGNLAAKERGALVSCLVQLYM